MTSATRRRSPRRCRPHWRTPYRHRCVRRKFGWRGRRGKASLDQRCSLSYLLTLKVPFTFTRSSGRCDVVSLGRPGVLQRLAGFRLPLRSMSRSARADDSASATQLLWRSCEHQGIADTHAATSRAQIDDLVAVMTFNGVDGHARQSACFFQVDNTLKFNPTRLDTIGRLCSVMADFACIWDRGVYAASCYFRSDRCHWLAPC
jgi:hypothetical protein